MEALAFDDSRRHGSDEVSIDLYARLLVGCTLAGLVIAAGMAQLTIAVSLEVPWYRLVQLAIGCVLFWLGLRLGRHGAHFTTVLAALVMATAFGIIVGVVLAALGVSSVLVFVGPVFSTLLFAVDATHRVRIQGARVRSFAIPEHAIKIVIVGSIAIGGAFTLFGDGTIDRFINAALGFVFAAWVFYILWLGTTLKRSEIHAIQAAMAVCADVFCYPWEAFRRQRAA